VVHSLRRELYGLTQAELVRVIGAFRVASPVNYVESACGSAANDVLLMPRAAQQWLVRNAQLSETLSTSRSELKAERRVCDGQSDSHCVACECRG
jgi:hypothetical protein